MEKIKIETRNKYLFHKLNLLNINSNIILDKKEINMISINKIFKNVNRKRNNLILKTHNNKLIINKTNYRLKFNVYLK